jgi:hypothetical protein
MHPVYALYFRLHMHFVGDIKGIQCRRKILASSSRGSFISFPSPRHKFDILHSSSFIPYLLRNGLHLDLIQLTLRILLFHLGSFGPQRGSETEDCS